MGCINENEKLPHQPLQSNQPDQPFKLSQPSQLSHFNNNDKKQNNENKNNNNQNNIYFNNNNKISYSNNNIENNKKINSPKYSVSNNDKKSYKVSKYSKMEPSEKNISMNENSNYNSKKFNNNCNNINNNLLYNENTGLSSVFNDEKSKIKNNNNENKNNNYPESNFRYNYQKSIKYTESNISNINNQSSIFSAYNTIKIKNKKISYEKYENVKVNPKDFKTILLIGEKRSGKSSFINCFLNYCLNVKYNEGNRYYITTKIKESTFELEEYFIKEKKIIFIDTPGFYGDEHIEEDENNLIDILDFISNKKINLIGFVVCSDLNRISEKNKKIIDLCFCFLKKIFIENIIIIYSNYNGDISLTSEQLLENINEDIFLSIKKKYNNEFKYVISNQNIFFEEQNDDENEKLYDNIIKNFNQFYNVLNNSKPIEYNFKELKELTEELNQEISKFKNNFKIYFKSLKKEFNSFFSQLNNYNYRGNKFNYSEMNIEKLKNVLKNIIFIDYLIKSLNKNSLITKKTYDYIKINLNEIDDKDLFESIYNIFESNNKHIESVLKNINKIDDYIFFNRSFQNSYSGYSLKQLLRENNIEEIVNKFAYPSFNQNEYNEIKNKENFLNIIKEKYNVEKDLYYNNKYDYTIYKLIYDNLNN